MMDLLYRKKGAGLSPKKPGRCGHVIYEEDTCFGGEGSYIMRSIWSILSSGC